MGWLSDFFGGGKNPADAAMPYLNKIPGVGHQYYDPYVSTGLQSLGQLSNQYSNMASNPTGNYNSLASGYKESPGYQFALQQAMNAGNNAAA